GSTGRFVSQISRPGGKTLMKKLLLVLAVFAVAAACGGGGSVAPASGGANYSTSNGADQSVKGQPGGTTAGGGTSTGGGTAAPGDTVPALQGPPVIRQAQLSITVDSGSFDSKLSAVRKLVE